MITVTTYIAHLVSVAIFNSVATGFLCYLLTVILSQVFKKAASGVKYHLHNLALLTVFISFLVPFISLVHLQPHSMQAPVIASQSVITPAYTNNTAAAQLTQTHAPFIASHDVIDAVKNKLTAWSNIILISYLIGLLLFSARLWASYLFTLRLKKNGIAQPDSDWQNYLSAAKTKLNIRRSINLAFSSQAISPCIIGYGKAIILIPIALVNNLTTEQAEAILLHELAHFKQYDYYINLITQFIGCVLFFNPFSWLIIKKCKQYRELSCDEIAARQNYSLPLAESLLRIAELQTLKTSLALNLKSNDHSLLYRIQNLLNIKNERRTVNIIPVGLVTIIVIVCLMLVNPAKVKSAPKDDLNTRLAKISTQMYNEGNDRFILVDAIKDSLLKTDTSYNFLYDGGSVIKIGNNDLPEPFKSAYLTKMKNFFIGHDHPSDTGQFYCMRGDGIKLNDILNPKSALRTLTNSSSDDINNYQKSWQSDLYKEIARDHLADTLHDFSFHYNKKDGVFVNGKKLKGAMAKKYSKMCQEGNGADDFKIVMEVVPTPETYITVNSMTRKITTSSANVSETNPATSITNIEAADKLLAEIAKDNIADTSMKIFIACKTDEMKINFKAVTGPLGEKYKSLIYPGNSISTKMPDTYILFNRQKKFPSNAIPDNEYNTQKVIIDP